MMLLGRMVDPSERKRRSLSVIVFISISIGDWGCTSPKKRRKTPGSNTLAPQENRMLDKCNNKKGGKTGGLQLLIPAISLLEVFHFMRAELRKFGDSWMEFAAFR